MTRQTSLGDYEGFLGAEHRYPIIRSKRDARNIGLDVLNKHVTKRQIEEALYYYSIYPAEAKERTTPRGIKILRKIMQ